MWDRYDINPRETADVSLTCELGKISPADESNIQLAKWNQKLDDALLEILQQ
jgi:hypothetical protein